MAEPSEKTRRRIEWLKNEIANSPSQCPMDYADWIWELRELESKTQDTTNG